MWCDDAVAAAESALTQGDRQSDHAVDDKVTIRATTTDDKDANERRESDDGAREAANGPEFDDISTSGSRRRNDAKRSSAELEATWTTSAVDERRKLRGGRQETELTPQTGDEWKENVSKDVTESSDRRGTEIISLEKGVFGLGFCIEGGRDCPTGRAPVTVKRLFRGELVFFIAVYMCL